MKKVWRVRVQINIETVNTRHIIGDTRPENTRYMQIEGDFDKIYARFVRDEVISDLKASGFKEIKP